MSTRVLLGLSGGVDSAVAAHILLREGYSVTACFMRNWDSLANNDILGNPHLGDVVCPEEQDYRDAKKIAEKLGIELLRADFVKEYWDSVFERFLKEYERGRTPDPDIWCNKLIKFDAFLRFARENGFEKIAMGHYAGKQVFGGHCYVTKGADPDKDQSYFLAQLSEEQVRSCVFPLRGYLKKDVRKIAADLGLSVAKKKGSTGICFIGERHFRSFLANYLPARPGDVVDVDTGKVIGRHDGVYYYTIGQHRGLGLGGLPGKESRGWYVVKKDAKKNVLYVANGGDNVRLLSDRAVIEEVNLVGDPADIPSSVSVKFRYRQKDVPAVMRRLEGGRAELRYAPFPSVATGQEAAIYDGERLLGGGTIAEVYSGDVRTDI